MESEKRQRVPKGFRIRRSWLLLPTDVFLIALATVVSFELRFQFHIPSEYHSSFVAFTYLRVIIYIPFYVAFGLYSRVWRHASVKDMEAILYANGLAACCVKVIDLLLPKINLPLSVWVSCCLLTLSCISCTRFLWRVLAQWLDTSRSEPPASGYNTLIFGAGSAGLLVSKEIQRTQRTWRIVGFVDDDLSKHGLILNGYKILGTKNELNHIIGQHKVDQILVAIPSMNRSELRRLVDALNEFKIPIFIVPPITKWMVEDSNLFTQVRQVQVEDLLGRDPLPINVETVGRYLPHSVVLVTGAGGSIGSEICRQVAGLNPQHLILVGRGENSIFEIQQELKNSHPSMLVSFVIGDIRDRRKMEYVFRTYEPDVVFHAAAHKHVPLMEANPDEAFVNNVIGTKNLADLAAQHGVHRFILVSSDKAVRPTNVMGASKRVAEMVLQDAVLWGSRTCFVTVRFGNVLGSRGSVVRVFRKQIENGGPITVTDERMVRYFMTIPEAVRLVVEAGAVGSSGDVFLLDMGEPVRIMDLAERMIRLSGFEPGVDIPIKVTGIRPGEKLFEELSREGTDSEIVDGHDGIWSMRCPVMPSFMFEQALKELRSFYEQGDYGRLGEAIKSLAWWEPSGAAEVAASLSNR